MQRAPAWKVGVFVATWAALAGCEQRGPVADDQALRAELAADAARVLDGEGAHGADAEWMAREPVARIQLPRRGTDAIELTLPDTWSLRIREDALAGDAHAVGSAIAYSSPQGVSTWRAQGAGYEEWLLLRHARAGTAAAWTIEGATPRQRGEAVELTDARGRVRFTVTAPEAHTLAGRAVGARLSVDGQRVLLALDADAAGEAVLVDPLWLPTGALVDPRHHHTATLLDDGRVLIVGGTGAANNQNGGGSGGDPKPAEVYDPTTGSWSEPDRLFHRRALHTATKLKSGRVLVVGGIGGAGPVLDTAELFDPATNKWSKAASLKAARQGHVAELLPDGRVLIAGGEGASGPIASAEIYDPAADAWTPAASLATARTRAASSVLPSGRVLVSGGAGAAGPLASTEIYDPVAGTWNPTGAMAHARSQHTQTVLKTGTVLAVGGTDGQPLAAAELYDPTTGAWSSAGALGAARTGHASALSRGGHVIVTAGQDASGASLASCEEYDPATNTWQATDTLNYARTFHTATLLSSGYVLVAGGASGGAPVPIAELLDTTWSPTSALAEGRYYHSATRLADGRVMVAGGLGASGALTSTEVWNPTTALFTTVSPLPDRRYHHTATLLASGQVLVAGGYDGSAALTSAALFDPATNAWTPTTGPLAHARYQHTATRLADGRVLIAGGRDTAAAALASSEIYDPATGAFTPAAGLIAARWGHAAAALDDGTVLVSGGTGTLPLASAEIYFPTPRAWGTTGPMSTARSLHTATRLADGRVLVAGGDYGHASAEIFDPAAGAFSGTSTLVVPRSQHTATFLGGGRVVLAGGVAATSLAATELFDPPSGTWLPAHPLGTDRYGHTATSIGPGLVLIAGGFSTTHGILTGAEVGRFPACGDGALDPGEQCDGAGGCCTAACTLAPAGLVCQSGPCSQTSTCTGTSSVCPAKLRAAGTACSNGACSQSGTCTGVSPACPASPRAAGTVCRASAGPCDAAETCDGAAFTCPTDALSPKGTVCRAPASACDEPEICSGTALTCPADTVGLGDGNACTTNDVCSAVTHHFYGSRNDCAALIDFHAVRAPDGVHLLWRNPTAPGVTIKIFRTNGGHAVTRPDGSAGTLVYSGTGTSTTDSSAYGGLMLFYTAFAVYPSGGWAWPAVATITFDDSDRDGMPDGWELRYAVATNPLDPFNPGDAGLDPDGDGLTNLEEYLHGTNPNVADSDGDGLPDGFEVRLGTSPTSQDTDGDAMADGFELSQGLDPLNVYDFAIGDFLGNGINMIGAYVVDSGYYGLTTSGTDVTPAPLTSTSNQLVISSIQQGGPVGQMGFSSTGYTYAGYLYTTEEHLAPNFAPTCSAGVNQTVNMPATVALAGSGSDPNGDPISFSWDILQAPTSSTAVLVGADTATPTLTPDFFGDYVLRLRTTDLLGMSSMPCYTKVTAIQDGVFYTTGPFTAFSPNFKTYAQTVASGGDLSTPAATSASFQLGAVVGDASLVSAPNAVPADLTGTAYTADAGFLSVVFGLFGFTANVAPTANAGPDQTLAYGVTTVTLDGSGSNDPDSGPNPLTYTWTWWSRPFGSAAVLTTTTDNPQATFIPDVAGSYVALLQVSDGELTSVPDPVIVTVAATPPVADAGPDITLAKTSPMPTVTLDGTGSHVSPGTTGTLLYAWTFFRRPDGSAAALTGADTATPSFVPDKIGNYVLRLVVHVSGVLVSTPDFATVVVTDVDGNRQPLANAGADQSLVGTNQTGLDGSGSSDPDWDHVTAPEHFGLGWDWQFVSKPAGSTAFIACNTTESPAWDCVNPVLHANGSNGTYVIGLRVFDVKGLASDLSTVTVSFSGITNVPPVAVATPPYKTVNLKTTSTTVFLSGASSYDPVVAAETLTYQWTLVARPAGSTAALVNATTSAPSITADKTGTYQAHLKVCDSTGLCSCAPGESRPGDAFCNTRSLVTITTSDDVLRVAMPAGWPAVTDTDATRRQHGSGGSMRLQMSDDGVYDKPVVIATGFRNLPGSHGDSADVISRFLRAQGYDVWIVEYDPICDDNSIPDLNAAFGQGGAVACAVPGQCTCGVGHASIEQHIPLNAVVAVYALKQAKEYGACGGKPADGADPCFVRAIGPSMGGLMLRYALAWAEDSARDTVPFALSETSDYALDGIRAKPGTRGTSSNVLDVGVRVFVGLDSPQQGANIPTALLAFVKNYEANTPDPQAAGGGMQSIAIPGGGLGAFATMMLLNWDGLRRFVIDHKGAFKDMIDFFKSDVFKALNVLYKAFKLYRAYKAAPGIGGLTGGGADVALSAIGGFLSGLAVGLEWGVVGAVVDGIVTYLKVQLYALLLSSGPWGIAAAVVLAVLDYFFGISDLFFDVNADFQIDVSRDADAAPMPVNVSKILGAPATREMLYASVTTAASCPDAAPVLQGNSVDALTYGFGKKPAELCKGTYNVGTTTAYHDAFFADLRALNGGLSYPRKSRNVGVSFGSRGIIETPASETMLMGMHLPYIVADQTYPLGPHDHEPGSLADDLFMAPIGALQLGLIGKVHYVVELLGFDVDEKTDLIFDDALWFPKHNDRWPFIPTQSALDLTRPGSCDASLPCCQLLPTGTAPHPADDGARNCCLCTTGYDAVFSPPININHIAMVSANPCVADDASTPPVVQQHRDACRTVPAGTPDDQHGALCPKDDHDYLFTTPDGWTCNGLRDDAQTLPVIELIMTVSRQLDLTRSCTGTTATFVCNDGSTTCAANDGHWVWLGGTDRDGDGCPGQYTDASGVACPSFCESDAADGDTTNVTSGVTGNVPPVIDAVSTAQTFALPRCAIDATHHAACVATTGDASTGAPLTVSVTAHDGNTPPDPLTYLWEFVPASGQRADEVTIAPASSPTPAITVHTAGREPQGTYVLRVTVRDNKGGATTATTSVIVPGDQRPIVTAATSAEPEICEFRYSDVNHDAFRCYAHLTLTGTAIDPDGTDATSILFTRWEDVTDRATSGYRAIVTFLDPYALDTVAFVYASEAHVTTPVGGPLRFQLTATDIHGQDRSIVVEAPVTGGP
jgi:Galactose oxidase, central domain/K319L-like, PKD domain/Bacterial TSP3 repeat/Kelch motif